MDPCFIKVSPIKAICRFGHHAVLQLFSLTILFVCCAYAEKFDHYHLNNHYDDYFKQYSQRYFGPNFDWRYFKAQAIAESRLKKEARSVDGAVGLMQILPKTFREVRSRNTSIESDPWHPRWNIAAALYYNRMMWETWDENRPFLDRLCFMFGAYNAGKGAILRAQRIAKKMGLNPNGWRAIEKALPKAIGADSLETIAYVRLILKIRQTLPD